MEEKINVLEITAICSFGNASPVYILIVAHPEVNMTTINAAQIESPCMIDFRFMFDPFWFQLSKLHAKGTAKHNNG